MNLTELAPRAAEAENFLKAMANRHRLMIMCELHKGECHVSALRDAVGLSQSSLSQHLSRLREDDLVKTRRDAQTIYYSLSNPNVVSLIALLYEFYCKAGCEPTTLN
jgi:DNA-binding transcriptional ArsR family regulator